MTPILHQLSPDELPTLRRDPVDADTLAETTSIVEDVRLRGEVALREHTVRLGDREPDQPFIYDRDALNDAVSRVDVDVLELLERTADRIRRFAEAQRSAFSSMSCEVPGGRAGHDLVPVERAGCYAPGGRYPLPSTILMTAVTARVAGVSEVLIASPRPLPVMLAAARIAGADAFVAVGGAQAIAAMAHGAGPVPVCDVVVGPGNRFVTAAKQIVSGVVRIDMLAGPSEVVIVADETADPVFVAADLLAQAEHDVDARVVLVTTSRPFLVDVERELGAQLAVLPNRDVVLASLRGSYAVISDTAEGMADICNRIAPEHVQVVTRCSKAMAARLRHYGSLFIGSRSPVVLGDYGIGPNHVLPTDGTARSFGGLSILTFLRLRTWLEMSDPGDMAPIVEDAVRLARMEGLEGHARSAILRMSELRSRAIEAERAHGQD